MINIITVKLLSLDKQKCSRDYTLLFVAFDLEERQPTVNTSCSKSGNCPCSGGSCGSYYFVQNFSQYLNNSGVGFQGAIVLETILNYNTTPNSQVFPSGLKPYFTETYNKISQNGFTGDFLALIGRSTYDRRLIDGITNAFKEDGMFLQCFVTIARYLLLWWSQIASTLKKAPRSIKILHCFNFSAGLVDCPWCANESPENVLPSVQIHLRITYCDYCVFPQPHS